MLKIFGDENFDTNNHENFDTNFHDFDTNNPLDFDTNETQDVQSYDHEEDFDDFEMYLTEEEMKDSDPGSSFDPFTYNFHHHGWKSSPVTSTLITLTSDDDRNTRQNRSEEKNLEESR